MRYRCPSLSATTIKYIAIISMLIDHIGAGIIYGFVTQLGHKELTDTYYLCRYIGRVAFPIFCYFIVEGVFHTKDIRKYLRRLFVFAIISEIPFDMALNRRFFDFTHQNVFFTLFLGVLSIYLIDWFYSNYRIDYELRVIGAMAVFAITFLVSYYGKTDYSGDGVLIIVAIYMLKGVPYLSEIIGPVLLIIWECVNAIGKNKTRYFQIASIFAIPILLLYNQKRGRHANKWFFYLFYPLHLLIIGIICMRYIYG